MTNLNIEVGKSYFIHNNNHSMAWGTVDTVTPKWIHIQGIGRTRSKWILVENIASVSDSSKPTVIISQMFDH